MADYLRTRTSGICTSRPAGDSRRSSNSDCWTNSGISRRKTKERMVCLNLSSLARLIARQLRMRGRLLGGTMGEAGCCSLTTVRDTGPTEEILLNIV